LRYTVASEPFTSGVYFETVRDVRAHINVAAVALYLHPADARTRPVAGRL
jgi:hypothetical protein